MLNFKRLNQGQISVLCKLEAVKPTLNKRVVWAIRSTKGFDCFLDRARLTSMHTKFNGTSKILTDFFDLDLNILK